MFNHNDYANGGYDDGAMGDLSDYLQEFATGLLPGSMFQQGAELALGAAQGSALPGLVSSSQSAKVTAPSGLKLRSQPNENSSMVTLLAQGTTVAVVKTGLPPTGAAPKGWTQVRAESGQEGYVSTEWLSISSPTSSSSGNTFSPSLGGSSSSSSSSALSTVKPSTPSSSIFDNKLLVGGAVVVVLVVGAAVAFGGKKKKAA